MAARVVVLERAERERVENENQENDYYNLFDPEADRKQTVMYKIWHCFNRACRKKSRVSPEGLDEEEESRLPPDYYSHPAYWPKASLVVKWYLYLATLCRMVVGGKEVLISETAAFTGSSSLISSRKKSIKPQPRNRMCYVTEQISFGTLRVFDLNGQLLSMLENVKLSEIAEYLAPIKRRELKNQLKAAGALADKFNNLILLAIIVAGINVGIQTYPDMDNNGFVLFLDTIVLLVFSFEMGVKIVMQGFAPWLYLTGPEWKWNTFDATIIILSYPIPIFDELLGGNNSIALLRLVRLARLGKLINKLPALKMIVQGLIAGMSSIRYVVLLLLLVFYLYGVVGYYLFASNDPFHFGSLPMAMYTLFRIACLDNWSDIMYVNIYGCNYYTDGMYNSTASLLAAAAASSSNSNGSSNSNNIVAVNPIYNCDSPQEAPIASTVYFLSFVLAAALIMLSLFIGAVTVAMVDSMEDLKRMAAMKKAEAAKAINEDRAAAMLKIHKRDLNRKRKSLAAKHAGKALGISELLDLGNGNGGGDNNDDNDDDDNDDDDDDDGELSKEQLEKLLKSRPLPHPLGFYCHYKLFRLHLREKDAVQIKTQIAVNLKIAIGKSGDKMDKDLEATADEFQKHQNSVKKLYLSLGKAFYLILQTSVWQNLMTSTILVASMLVGMQTDYRLTRYQEVVDLMDAIDYLVLLIFTGEIVLKVVALGVHPLMYFKDGWNVFDFLIVAGSWVPGSGGGIVMLRLLRLLRVLKLVKRFPQLAVIINALLNGFSSIGWIAVVLFLFFYVYAILGMLIFSQSDPWHFTYLHRAFITLFKGITLDNWSSDSYTLIYGCDVYPGVYSDFPEQCTDPKAFGLVAGVYYFVLILFGTQVLLNLFIGVISTSLDDSRATNLAEQELDRRLAATAKKLILTPERIESFRIVFNLLDLDQGGSIDFEELQQGLQSINANMTDEEIMNILLRIDPEGLGLDVNGFINFMAETPLFSRGAMMVKMLNSMAVFRGGVGGQKKGSRRRKTWLQILTNPLESVKKWTKQGPLADLWHGSRAAREHHDELYAALMIQDVWKERQETRRAQREAKAIIDIKVKERLAARLAVQRNIEQSGEREKNIIRDGRKYDDDGVYIANTLPESRKY